MNVLKNECSHAPLTVFLNGRIDLNNAAAWENELFHAADAAEGSLILNAKNLKYISSAGLRVLINLKKSKKTPISVVQVSPEVYSIFKMTGFTEVMDIRKEQRKIEVKENEIIAKGTIGTLYRIDEDTVVKVFEHRTTKDMIERERENARKAFLAGIPSVITYDIVNVNDRLGIVLEMVKGSTLSEKLNHTTADRNRLIREYTGLLQSVHNTQMKRGAFPDARDIYHGYIDAAAYFDSGQKKALHRLVNAVPDALTVLHGDFHPNNVMYLDGEMVVVDLSDISLGNPLFDLAGMYFTHISIGLYRPLFIREGMGISYEISQELWHGFCDQYFAQSTRKERAWKEDVIRRFSMLKLALVYAIAPGFEQHVGWEPLYDAEKILFGSDSYEKLVKDVAEFEAEI